MGNTIQCNYCKNPVQETDSFCPTCKYPLKGTDQEKSIFVGQQILKKDTISTAKNYRKFSKYVLILLGLFMSIPEIIKFFGGFTTILELFIGVVLGGIFVVLGFMTNKYPIGSIATGIILILLTDILLGYFIFSNFYSGQFDFMDIWKWIIKETVKIGLLGYAVYKTIEERKIKQEHLNLNSH